VRTAVRDVANSTTSKVVASKDIPVVIMTTKMTNADLGVRRFSYLSLSHVSQALQIGICLFFYWLAQAF
jgi:hypothetical protein